MSLHSSSVSWISDPTISVKIGFLSWRKSRTWSGKELQAGFEYIWQHPGEFCKAACQVLRIWSGGTPLFTFACHPTTFSTWAVFWPGTSSYGVCLHLITSSYVFTPSSNNGSRLGLGEEGTTMIKAAEKVFEVQLGNHVLFLSSLYKFSCFFHFMANWAKAKLPIQHCLTTSLFLTMTGYGKNSSLKWEKLVIRASMQFQKQSDPNSQQLNFC